MLQERLDLDLEQPPVQAGRALRRIILPRDVQAQIVEIKTMWRKVRRVRPPWTPLGQIEKLADQRLRRSYAAVVFDDKRTSEKILGHQRLWNPPGFQFKGEAFGAL
jgi:hypothetical protein